MPPSAGPEPEREAPEREAYDLVIVGAGTAGCVAAARLSESGRLKILLLEAGGSDRRVMIKMPIGYGRLFHDPAVNWRYHSEAQAGLAGRSIYLPRGKVVGGSGSINAMVYMRGLPADYDAWADAGNPGWGWDQARQAFDALECRIEADGSRRGDGPVVISDVSADHHPLVDDYLAAAAELNQTVAPDLSRIEAAGVGHYRLTTRHGRRWSAGDGFLRPALTRKNLRLLTGAHVCRLVMEGRRVVGVVYRRNGREHIADAGVGVIMAAGAVATPHLLTLSGIGPAADINAIGAGVVCDNRAVGKNLQDHLGINYILRSRVPSLNRALGRWPGRLRAGVNYVVRRRGAFAASVNHAGGFVRWNTQGAPNLQIYFNPLSYSAERSDKRLLLQPDRLDGFVLSFQPCRPESRGAVRTVSPDPATAPRIDPGFLADPADEADVKAGMDFIRRLMATDALRRVIREQPPGEAPSIGDMDDAQGLEDFRRRAVGVYHLAGSCAMKPAADGGVVSGRMAVHGIGGLWVVDASVFPNLTSGNITAPVIMTAWRGAGMIRHDLERLRG